MSDVVHVSVQFPQKVEILAQLPDQEGKVLVLPAHQVAVAVPGPKGDDGITLIIAASGTNISFQAPQIYNSPSEPGTDDFTANVEGARIGVVQKIYHSSSPEPNFPGNWVRLGTNVYDTESLNVIFAEWVSENRIEYWIVQ